MAKRKKFLCPTCNAETILHGASDRHSYRTCSGCGHSFRTTRTGKQEVYDQPWTPRSGRANEGGYAGKPPKRQFKLAPHHRLVPTHRYGKFGPATEIGFKLLRDPQTGFPVAREHGDLRPGEISLVLE